jgi:RNA polymerase sigma factor (sigma-70 family)
LPPTEAQPPQPLQPHLDPNAWGRLVDSLDVASIFVAIGSWISGEQKSRIAVEDIWQETLWLAWRDRQQHDWKGLGPYRGWLLGIARHRVADACRQAGRQKRGGVKAAAAFTDLAPDSVSGYLPPQSTTPSRIAGHRERAMVMERALQTLEPSLQQVVQLRLFEELPTREVAERLAIPLSTAKERLLRGVQRYRDLLAGLLRGDSISDQSSTGS